MHASDEYVVKMHITPICYIFRARLTVPHFFKVVDDVDQTVKMVATETIPAKTKLGPYEAKRTTQDIVVNNGFVLKVGAFCSTCI